jgi:hypothetical protein
MSSSTSSAVRETENGARLRRLRDDDEGCGDGDAAHDLAAGRRRDRSRRFHGLVAASACGCCCGAAGGGGGGARSSGSGSEPVSGGGLAAVFGGGGGGG